MTIGLSMEPSMAVALLAALVESSNDTSAGENLGRHRHQLEQRCRTSVRLHRGGDDRSADSVLTAPRAPGRNADDPRADPAWRALTNSFDTTRRRKDGSVVEISLTVSPIYDAAGRIVGASKIARDISERRAAERQQELLLGELDHRVRNTLMVVLGLTSQTLSPGPERDALLGRLHAIAHEARLCYRHPTGGRYASES